VYSMAKLIVLSGCDGSGKTTAITILLIYLSKRFRVSVHWLRGSHLHVSILYRILSKFSVFKGFDNPYYRFSAPSNLRPLLALLEFTGFLPQFFSRLLKKLISDVVLCDRGVLDFLVWVMATLRYGKFLNSVLGRFLFALSLKELPIVLTASFSVLSSRADVPREFLAREYMYYSVLQKYLARLVIDSSKDSPARVVARVLKSYGIQDS